MIKQIVNFLTSLRLTVVCLCLALLLVFIGTLAQVDEGLYAAQNRYFRSFLIYWSPKGADWGIPVMPGGYLLGGLLLVNLVAAHWQRFTLTRKKLGIYLTHVGLILLLLGGLVTDLFQVETHLRLTEGQTKNYSESGRQSELAVIDKSNPDSDLVITIPEAQLANKGEIRHPQLPFTVRVKDYFPNSWPKPRAPMVETRPPQASQGAGRQFYFEPRAVATKMSDQNIPAATLEVVTNQGSQGTWAVSNWAVDEPLLLFLHRKQNWPESLVQNLSAPQQITCQARTYEIALRPVRHYVPYTIQLRKFTHDRYKGTDLPKNFASDIILRHPGTGEERSPVISMNKPLRYAGKTYYQAGFDAEDPRVTILQVVRNPGWLAPYISCGMIALGLCIQFLTHLVAFAKKSAAKVTGGKPATAAKGQATQEPVLAHGAGAAPERLREKSSGRLQPAGHGKFIWPWIVVGVFAFEAVFALRPRAEKELHLRGFGQLPVLLNGRIQPIDSVARNALLQIRSTQSVPLEGNGGKGQWGAWEDLRGQGPMSERNWWQFTKHPKRLKPTEWLLEVMTRTELADQRPIFLIHHPDLLSELKLEDQGVENSGLRYYTFNELRSAWPRIEKQAEQIHQVEPEVQTAYQKQVAKLENALILYHRLKNSLQPEGTADFTAQLAQFQKSIAPGVAAARAQSAGQDYDQEAFARLLSLLEPYDRMAKLAYPLMIPPVAPETARDDWTKVGQSLMETARNGQVQPAVTAYAAMATAYTQGRAEEFNRALADYRDCLAQTLPPELKKGAREFFFNNYQPFYRAMLIYLAAFILGGLSWFNWSETLRRSAFYLAALALAIHTAGLVFRMFLEGRPPVTNLYSSAIFIGWGAAVLGLVLERIFRDGIGAVVAAAVGFTTLIIAHNLALGGDTMEMLRAVLDTNFWLATHVTTVTLGYASTFVAGFLAMIYILRGLLTRTLTPTTAKALARMVYGIICFATLFSFVGTILGGIWADQSWGRFWGWDPKENGALIIVIWNAAILHARWSGLVRERGLMNMAIFGNIVTSFSWFGVNMLGIGLHSYGFMDAAFKWLMLFVGSQVLLIALGLLPARWWLSFRLNLRAT